MRGGREALYSAEELLQRRDAVARCKGDLFGDAAGAVFTSPPFDTLAHVILPRREVARAH